MLVLTAFHDIMTIEDRPPPVQAHHDGFRGFAAGVVIHYHDCALAYVLKGQRREAVSNKRQHNPTSTGTSTVELLYFRDTRHSVVIRFASRR